MNITKENIKDFIKEAIMGFFLWTGFLSPYMIFVTGMTEQQYISWLIMQGFIVPPISVIVFRITNYFCGKKVKCTECAVGSHLTKLWNNREDEEWGKVINKLDKIENRKVSKESEGVE